MTLLSVFISLSFMKQDEIFLNAVQGNNLRSELIINLFFPASHLKQELLRVENAEPISTLEYG